MAGSEDLAATLALHPDTAVASRWMEERRRERLDFIERELIVPGSEVALKAAMVALDNRRDAPLIIELATRVLERSPGCWYATQRRFYAAAHRSHFEPGVAIELVEDFVVLWQIHEKNSKKVAINQRYLVSFLFRVTNPSCFPQLMEIRDFLKEQKSGHAETVSSHLQTLQFLHGVS